MCAGCSCNENDATKSDMKFDKSKWELKSGDLNYTYRKLMINDLLNSYKWAGTKKDSVIKLLGEPDVIEEDIFMLYHYEQKFLFGNFPLSTQSLVIHLVNDSTVKLARTN
jgi:hypothetical protein